MQTAAPPSALEWIGEHFHFVLLAYLAIYVLRFLLPVLRQWGAGDFGTDLADLRHRLARDQKAQDGTPRARRAALERERATLAASIAGAEETLRTALGAGGLETAGRIQNAELPALVKRAGEIEAELRGLQDEEPTRTADRLANLEVLAARYTDPFVADAAEQIRSQFPRADVQHFRIGSLPSVAAYQERVSSARSMAGVFVLLGLLGTLLRLNGVVGIISTLTRNTVLAPDEFMRQMGSLMTGIGGAFDHSIHGVLLMIVAVFAVSFVDSAVQRRVDELDACMAGQVLPGLARIQNSALPEISLADVLRGTSVQLQALDRTVESLTRGMDASLGKLGTGIEDMLQQFGTVQQHYVTLNSWVGKLEDASAALTRSTGEASHAALRLAHPVDQMNATLREHLAAQAETSNAAYLGQILQELKQAVEGSRREQEAAFRSLTHNAEAAIHLAAESSRAHVAAADAQSARVEREIAAVRAALQAAGSQQLSATLAQMRESQAKLGDRLERSAASFEAASRNLAAYAAAPTFFYWLTQVWWRRVRARTGRRPTRPQPARVPVPGTFTDRPVAAALPDRDGQPTAH